MLSKNEVKDIQSLRHKKFRDEAQLFIAEGPKIVAELLAIVPRQFQKVYATKDWINTHSLSLTDIDHQMIDDVALGKLSQLQTPNEVVAVLRQFPQIEPPSPNNFLLYLDTIQDPGNFGTIVRIADWFGINNIVCSEGCADLYNSKVVQATMASIARVSIFYDQGLNWLQKQSVPKYAAALNGEPVYELNGIKDGILIIGNESKGIQPDIMQAATKKITIPRIGEAESLNAAVATGIILSHLLR